MQFDNEAVEDDDIASYLLNKRLNFSRRVAAQIASNAFNES